MIILSTICLIWSVWAAIYENRIFWRIAGIICIPLNTLSIIAILAGVA